MKQTKDRQIPEEVSTRRSSRSTPSKLSLSFGSGPENLTVLRVGFLLSRYKSGPLPKALKILPSLPHWAQLLALTEPTKWTPHATYACTKIFVSNLKPTEVRVYLEGVLLDKCREDMRANAGKLNVHLYEALKKSLYKPAAFFKGILFPLCEVGILILVELELIQTDFMLIEGSSDSRIGPFEGICSGSTFSCNAFAPGIYGLFRWVASNTAHSMTQPSPHPLTISPPFSPPRLPLRPTFSPLTSLSPPSPFFPCTSPSVSLAPLFRVPSPGRSASTPSFMIMSLNISGPNSLFIRILLDKKYALPYKVVDALVFHFIRLANSPRSRTGEDKLPVLWHQSMLVFVQR